MAIMCAILIPPLVIVLLTLLMAAEANWVFDTRLFFFGAAPDMAPVLHH
jgi:cytochrome c oxidase subunit IV